MMRNIREMKESNEKKERNRKPEGTSGRKQNKNTRIKRDNKFHV